MTEIKTNFGTVYVEESFDDEKVKVFDSRKEYIDYIEISTLESISEEKGISYSDAYELWIEDIQECTCVKEFLAFLSLDYNAVSTDWKYIASYLLKECGIDKYSSPESLLTNEWVNKIGNYYVLVAE